MHCVTICPSNNLQQSARGSGRPNSPSGGDVVCVRRTGSDFPGQTEVSYFHQLRTHAQQVFRLQIAVKKAYRGICRLNGGKKHNQHIYYEKVMKKKPLKMALHNATTDIYTWFQTYHAYE